MARIRSIKPEFWIDETVGTLSPMERLLFIGMWTFADDEGLLRANPLYLRSVIFPYDKFQENEIQTALDALEGKGLVYLYAQNNQHYAWIIRFRLHQRIDKPQKPTTPGPSIQNSKFKDALHKRDKYICHICHRETDPFCDLNICGSTFPTIDHIIPKSEGGSDYPTNLKTACSACNKVRGDKSLPAPFQEDSRNNPGEVLDGYGDGKGRGKGAEEQERGLKPSLVRTDGAAASSDAGAPDPPPQDKKQPASKHPPCPYLEIIEAYHQGMPANPRIVQLDKTSEKNLQVRWREDPARQNVQWWVKFFAWCNQSNFLTGRKTDFIADLMWLVRPQNFAKAIAGRYHHENKQAMLPQKTLQNLSTLELMKKRIEGGAYDQR